MCHVREDPFTPSSRNPTLLLLLFVAVFAIYNRSGMADSATLKITLLGAGQEVGRSCCVIQYRGKTIVCDAGVHPAYSGIASLPFVDELDWSTVDVLLITQCVTYPLSGNSELTDFVASTWTMPLP